MDTEKLPGWQVEDHPVLENKGQPERQRSFPWLSSPTWQRAAQRLEDTAALLSRAWPLEILLITLVVLGYCAGFLNLATDSRLPGNEAEVFQFLDWTLVNSLGVDGRFPLWNPYLRTGIPFVADPMLHVYNPVVTLPVLLLGVVDGYKVALALSFLIAALGMWYLARLLHLEGPLRLWVSLMYAFAGQPTARFIQGEYLFILGFAWIPWIMVGLELALTRQRKKYIALAALALAALFFSGNAYYPYLLLYVLAIFAFARLLDFKRQRPHIQLKRSQLGSLLLVGLLAFGLIAIQFLPLMKFWPYFSKGVDVLGSHNPAEIIRDFLSKDPFRADAFQSLPAREEYYAYLGWGPFLALVFVPLAIGQRRWRRWLVFLGLLVLFAVVFIDIKDMPWREAYLQARWLSQFRHPIRMLLFLGWALLLLGGLGLTATWRRLRRWRRSLPTSDGRVWLAWGAQATLLALLVWSVSDVYLTNRVHTRTVEPQTQAMEPLAWLRQYDPSGAYAVRIEPVNANYQAMVSNRMRFLDAWYSFDLLLPDKERINQRPVTAYPNYWLIPTEQPVDSLAVIALQRFPSYTVYSVPDSLPFAFTVADEALADSQAGELRRDHVQPQLVAVDGPNNLEMIVSGQAGNILGVMVSALPGWQVKVDGKPGEVKNLGGFLAAPVQTGVHIYRFTYRPGVFYLGLLISLVSLGIALTWLVRETNWQWRSALVWWRKLPSRLALGWQRVQAWVHSSRAKVQVTTAVLQDGSLHPEMQIDVPEGQPVRLTIETDLESARPWSAAWRRWMWATADLLGLMARPLVGVTPLFAGSLAIYLLVRLVGLAHFPIFFFTDEAVQTVLAADLVRDGLRNYDKVLLPTYFQNGNYYNLSVSVYLQVIPYLLFGKSVLVTRATSVLVGLLAALGVGLSLKNIFKLPYWWAGVLLLSATPAWFLHSRTAFETVIFVAFYAVMLYAYLLYRCRDSKYLYHTLVLAALAFYTYSPGQVVIAITGLLLLASDIRYHWQQRRLWGKAALLGLLLAVPYVRFWLLKPSASLDHLRLLNSYWLQPLPLGEKLAQYGRTFLFGLSPGYWYLPNEHDLPRHLMKGYGHLAIATLPFALLGLLAALKNWRNPAYRALLVAMLAAPAGSALVGIGITRVLVFVIPAALLTTIGLSNTLTFLESLFSRWRRDAGPTGSGQEGPASRWRQLTALLVFVVLSWANMAMLNDALRNGPTWYSDYGMGGLQYGARQVFDAIDEYLADHPEANILFSPTWANGTDVLARYFLGDPLPIRLGSVQGHLDRHMPLDEHTVFIITPDEYQQVLDSGKFTDLQIQQTLPYPDGRPGFYFLHMRYREDVDTIFAQESQARRQLQTATLEILDGPAQVRYSPVDMGAIELVFDGDSYTVTRTAEANPAVLEIEFAQEQALRGVAVTVGSIEAEVVARLSNGEATELRRFTMTQKGSVEKPTIHLDFGETVRATEMQITVRDIHQGEPAHVHIWEIELIVE